MLGTLWGFHTVRCQVACTELSGCKRLEGTQLIELQELGPNEFVSQVITIDSGLAEHMTTRCYSPRLIGLCSRNTKGTESTGTIAVSVMTAVISSGLVTS